MNQDLLSFIHDLVYHPAFTRASLGMMVVLALLLVLKEFARTAHSARRTFWLRTLDKAILPLLIVYGAILLLRFLSL